MNGSKKRLKEKTETVVVTGDDPLVRLDKFLVQKFPNISRSAFQSLIDQGLVTSSSLPVKRKQLVNLGDSFEITFVETPSLDVTPEEIPMEILYEDEHMIAINKPTNMVVHPAPGRYSGTFAQGLLHHCQEIDPDHFEATRPGIVHRLDKDTTGVLLGAKTKEAHQKLVAMFAAREVEKYYLAICVGTPQEGTYSAPLKRHPIKRKLMRIDQAGKEAITIFRVLAKSERLSLVEARLVTGRTHQIRVHLKSLNAPVLGDTVYGSPSANGHFKLDQQLLHAFRVQFAHPISGAPLELIAPVPSHMKNFIDSIHPSCLK